MDKENRKEKALLKYYFDPDAQLGADVSISCKCGEKTQLNRRLYKMLSLGVIEFKCKGCEEWIGRR